jgi:hypothetical protein
VHGSPARTAVGGSMQQRAAKGWQAS